MTISAAIDIFGKLDDLVDRIGAYAGFASLIGLALLTLLYFAQARELKRMHEWAAKLPEQVAGGQRAGTATTVAPPSAVAARPATAQVTTAAGAPPPPAVTPATTGKASAAGQATSSAGAAKPPSPSQPSRPVRPILPNKNGSAAGATGQANSTAARKQSGTTPLRQMSPQKGRGRPLGVVIAAVAGVLAVVGVITYAVISVGGDDGSPTQAEVDGRRENANGQAAQPARNTDNNAASKPTPAPVPKSKISVVVLNGTNVTGLANTLSASLKNEGYQTKNPADSPDKTLSSTLVLYAPGARPQALRVARSIDRDATSVRAVDPVNAAVNQGAAVTVVIGADQQAQATTGA